MKKKWIGAIFKWMVSNRLTGMSFVGELKPDFFPDGLSLKAQVGHIEMLIKLN